MGEKSCCVTGHRGIPEDKLPYVEEELRKTVQAAIPYATRVKNKSPLFRKILASCEFIVWTVALLSPRSSLLSGAASIPQRPDNSSRLRPCPMRIVRMLLPISERIPATVSPP